MSFAAQYWDYGYPHHSHHHHYHGNSTLADQRALEFGDCIQQMKDQAFCYATRCHINCIFARDIMAGYRDYY
jgi:hypothetical protein